MKPRRASDPDTPVPLRPVSRAFFARPVLEVARDLLGCILVRESDDGRVAGIVVETEAYGVDDPGSHAFRGRTERNAPMFEAPGRAYVYFTYGMHWMLNAVTDRAGTSGAVLLRAVEPIEGLELMRARRGASRKAPRAGVSDRDLARGPARLAQAFAVGPELNRADLTRPPLYVCAGERHPADAVERGPRIGLGSAQDGRDWRFWLAGNRYVSATVRVVPVRPGRRINRSG